MKDKWFVDGMRHDVWGEITKFISDLGGEILASNLQKTTTGGLIYTVGFKYKWGRAVAVLTHDNAPAPTREVLSYRLMKAGVDVTAHPESSGAFAWGDAALKAAAKRALELFKSSPDYARARARGCDEYLNPASSAPTAPDAPPKRTKTTNQTTMF